MWIGQAFDLIQPGCSSLLFCIISGFNGNMIESLQKNWLRSKLTTLFLPVQRGLIPFGCWEQTHPFHLLLALPAFLRVKANSILKALKVWQTAELTRSPAA